MKVITVVGARPQFVKAAVVSRQLAALGIEEVLVHTGQHHDQNMSEVFFAEMNIPRPALNLEVAGLDHGAMTGRMLEKLETVYKAQKPDYVLVYGDTNSTLAGALAASKLHIPVAHVEAGLRSFNMHMPEEINRILTDRISSKLFCPTATALENLQREGFANFNCTIEQSGDVMFDAVLYYRQWAPQRATVFQQAIPKENFLLATLHRAENTNDPQRLRAICQAFNQLHRQVPIVLPLHPRTRQFLATQKIELLVHVIEPVGYFDMLAMLERCRMVLTDSGGLQKEAYFFGKYCLTLRDQTEWVELVQANANSLCGANTETILSNFDRHQNTVVSAGQALYGNGKAAEFIAQSLAR
jgi:UDP-GlcNAc3NAcA epimerase